MRKKFLFDDIKIDSRNDNKIGYKTYYAKSDSWKNNKYNLEKNNPLYLFNKNIFKKQYKYNKLFSYSKEKIFLKEIKIYKDKKRNIYSNKMNKFHHEYIHNKMKSFSETPDHLEQTSNNKTTTISDATNKNYQNYKYSFLKTTNLLHYSSNSNKTRNKNNITLNNSLKTENNLYKSVSNNNNGISILKNNKGKKISNKNVTISNFLNINDNKDKKNITFLTLNQPTKVLNYKFNDAIGNLNNNVYCEGKLTFSRGVRNGFKEQILSKFRYNLINGIKKEFYETQFEIQQNPLCILKEYEIFQETNKKYYNIYQNIIKKYFGFLYAQIDEEKYKLLLLNEEREKLKEENFQITKKINSQNEKLIFYQNFMKLLLKIKYNTLSLDILPEEYLLKYGLNYSRPKQTGNGPNKRFYKRNTQILITETRTIRRPKYQRKTTVNLNVNRKIFNRTKSNNYNEIYKMNRDFKRLKTKDNSQQRINLYLARKKGAEYEVMEKIPIFNDVDELSERLKGINTHLKDLYKESSDKRYIIQILKMELYKESRYKKGKNIGNNDDSDLEVLKSELIKLKQKNTMYINFIKFLNDNKNKNYIEYKPKLNERNSIKENIYKINSKYNVDIFQENTKKNKKYKFADKIISILLKLDINIEEFVQCPGIYSFLKSPNEIKITNQGKEYMKVLFCIKVIEIIFLKLMEKRRDYLANSRTKNHYLKLEAFIEKNNKLMNINEKKEEEINERIRRDKEILIKSNKVQILPYKNDDPFSYNIYFEQFKKKEKERLKQLRKNEEIDSIFKNYISY